VRRAVVAARDAGLVVGAALLGWLVGILVDHGVPDPNRTVEGVVRPVLDRFPAAEALLGDPFVFLTVAGFTLGGVAGAVVRVVGGPPARPVVRVVHVGLPLVGAALGIFTRNHVTSVLTVVVDLGERPSTETVATAAAVVLGILVAGGALLAGLRELPRAGLGYLLAWALATLPVLVVCVPYGWIGLSVDGVRLDAVLVLGAAVGAGLAVRLVRRLRGRPAAV
jgi:hypothetical protein